MDDVLTLMVTEQAQDDFGVWRDTPAPREIFCKVDSVTRAEFFDGGRNGLNPEFRFTVFAGDYNGERDVVYRNNGYSVYRSYHVPGTDYMELYAERKGGTNGKAGNG